MFRQPVPEDANFEESGLYDRIGQEPLQLHSFRDVESRRSHDQSRTSQQNSASAVLPFDDFDPTYEAIPVGKISGSASKNHIPISSGTSARAEDENAIMPLHGGFSTAEDPYATIDDGRPKKNDSRHAMKSKVQIADESRGISTTNEDGDDDVFCTAKGGVTAAITAGSFSGTAKSSNRDVYAKVSKRQKSSTKCADAGDNDICHKNADTDVADLYARVNKSGQKNKTESANESKPDTMKWTNDNATGRQASPAPKDGSKSFGLPSQLKISSNSHEAGYETIPFDESDAGTRRPSNPHRSDHRQGPASPSYVPSARTPNIVEKGGSVVKGSVSSLCFSPTEDKISMPLPYPLDDRLLCFVTTV